MVAGTSFWYEFVWYLAFERAASARMETSSYGGVCMEYRAPTSRRAPWVRIKTNIVVKEGGLVQTRATLNEAKFKPAASGSIVHRLQTMPTTLTILPFALRMEILRYAITP